MLCAGVCMCIYILHTLPTECHEDGFQEDLFLVEVSDLKIRFKGWKL